MGRQANGTWVAPAGNPVVSEEVIESAWANTLVPDLGSDIEDSLSRSGKGAMLAPLKAINGTVAAPSYTFNSEASTGLYRQGAGDIRMTVLGVDYMRYLTNDRPAWWDGVSWLGLATQLETTSAQVTANIALTNAETAQTAADAAQSTADTASTTANTALANSTFAAGNFDSNAILVGTGININAGLRVGVGLYNITLSAAGTSIDNLICVANQRRSDTGLTVVCKAIALTTTVVGVRTEIVDSDTPYDSEFSLMVVDSGL